MKLFLVLVVCLAFSSAVFAEEVCQTAECKALSEDLLHHSMNESVAPCDDFFEYVCAKWPASHPQAADSHNGINYFKLRQKLVLDEIDEAFLNALNSSNLVIRSVAELYSSCLDFSTIEKRGVTPLIESAQRILGDWPLLQKNNSHKDATKTPHWQDLFVNVFSQTGLSPFFELDSHHNYTLKKWVVSIQEGIVGNDPYNTLSHNESHYDQYRAFLHKLATTYFAVPDNAQLKTDIEAVIHLEQKFIAAYTRSLRAQLFGSPFDSSYADLSIALKEKADFQAIVNQILAKLSLTKVPPVTGIDHVRAVLPYLVETVAILETTPISVLQNWLGLVLTFRFGYLTTTALKREIITFSTKNSTHLHFDLAERKADCERLPGNWPAVKSRIYIDTHFSKLEKAEAELLVKSLRIAFEHDLQNHTEWLDEKTRKAALEKLEAIKQTVGYEDWIISDETLNAEYPQLNNNQTILNGKYFESMVNLKADIRRKNLAKLHQENATIPPNRGSLVYDPTVVNAFYNRITNLITIPAGILQPPFFDDQRPYSMNYGAIGTVIGHELTHAFDNHGAEYDKNGKRKNWWTPETHAKFSEKSTCFAEQYGSLKEPLSGVVLNGNRTLGENIADNGGIKKAFDAYREHQKALGKPSPVLPNLKLTADQLFFIAHAHVWCENVTPEEAKSTISFSVHSPGRFRVNTVLGNTPAFAEAFKCPLGSKMNPVKKCSLW